MAPPSSTANPIIETLSTDMYGSLVPRLALLKIEIRLLALVLLLFWMTFWFLHRFHPDQHLDSL